MTAKHSISRKNFIKNCSATLGLLTVGLPELLASSTNKDPFYKSLAPSNGLATNLKRGSWANNGVYSSGEIDLSKVELIIAKNEHTAVQQAAKFLAEDLFKLTGIKPLLKEGKTQNTTSIIFATLGNADLPKEIKVDLLKNHQEAHQIVTATNEVWVVGADFRGTAFAAYTLSERLGIDPLYLWTGFSPIKNSKLRLIKTNYFAASPTVKYRGFFHDDEDVLPRPFDKYGFPLRIGDVPLVWYQRFFETALRLRMNMVAPYVRVHRRYEVQKCASDWGLYFTSHHYDILLSNPFGIERFHLAERRGVTTQWDWFKNKNNMIQYWRGGVEENAKINAIWPVGLRGTDDHAYEFPEGTPDKEQAKVFREAIDAQVKTVKELTTNENPAFHFTLYTEMLDKYKKHPEDFNVPSDVILVWPDNNDGVMRDLPAGKDKWKHGVYYHLAYFGGLPTKQGTHVVSPNKIVEQFTKIIDSSATEFMLVNVSELREHVMQARMIADICWDAKAILTLPNAANSYLHWFITEYFGQYNVKAIEKAYQDYFSLISDSEKTYFAATQFEILLDQLHRRFTKKPPNKIDQTKIDQLKSRNVSYDNAFKNINNVLLNLNKEQKQFFFEHIVFGLRVDHRPTQATLILAKALAEPNDAKAWELIAEAAIPLEKLELDILRTERPPFDKWHGATWIKTPMSPFNIHRSYLQIRAFINNNGTESPIQPKMTFGHNIEGAKLWSQFLEDSEKVKASY
jgi:hypothetical protein